MTSLTDVRRASYVLLLHFADGTTVSLLQGAVYIHQPGSC